MQTSPVSLAVTTRTAGSPAAPSKAAASAPMNSRLIALTGGWSIARTATPSVKGTAERGLSLALTDALGEEARSYVEAYLSADAREGLRAFLEKRPPRLPGR